MSTVPTFAVRETDVSRHNGGTSGSPIMPGDVSLLDSKCWNGGQKLVAKTQRWAKMGQAIAAEGGSEVMIRVEGKDDVARFRRGC